MIFAELETNDVSGSIDKFKSIVPDAMSAEDWFRCFMTICFKMLIRTLRFMALTLAFDVLSNTGFMVVTTMVKPS